MEASDNKQPAFLDTYARALFDSGKVSEALDCQKKAVALCEDDTLKGELQTALDKYQAAVDKAK